MVESTTMNSRDYNAAAATPPREFVVPPELAGRRLDQVLALLMPEYSRSRIQSWIEADAVRLNGARARARQKVWPGAVIRVVPRPHPGELPAQPEARVLPIVYEDEAILVLNKPAGLVVHPGSGNWSGTLMNALLHHAPGLAVVPRAGIVHRLDKDTSGLMVVAKTIEAQTDLQRQLAARSVRRVYLAVVEGRLSGEGRIEAPIGRHPKERTRMAVVERGKPALTHYRVLETFATASLVECRLETGRTHQIRVHMQALGHPLLGDPVYGSREGRRRHFRQALHATALSLTHPVSRASLSWQAPLPADLAALLAELAAP
jgi:23S rRNA pseudouridine1911/1915/1917 synthase